MDREYNRRSWKKEDIERLKTLISDGIRVKDEIEALDQGLKETIKAVAEELEVKPGQLSKAINHARKNDFHDAEEAFTELDDILSAAGRK